MSFKIGVMVRRNVFNALVPSLDSLLNSVYKELVVDDDAAFYALGSSEVIDFAKQSEKNCRRIFLIREIILSEKDVTPEVVSFWDEVQEGLKDYV